MIGFANNHITPCFAVHADVVDSNRQRDRQRIERVGCRPYYVGADNPPPRHGQPADKTKPIDNVNPFRERAIQRQRKFGGKHAPSVGVRCRLDQLEEFEIDRIRLPHDQTIQPFLTPAEKPAPPKKGNRKP